MEQDDHIQDWYDLAIARHREGSLSDAQSLYDRILSLRPNHAGSLMHRGLIEYQHGRHAIAIEWIGKALIREPDYAEAHYNLGVILGEQGLLADAVASYRRAIAARPPNDVRAWHIMGVTLREMGEPEAALNSYDCALAIDPGSAEIRKDAALVLLSLGRFERGWLEFEWRWKTAGYTPSNLPQPRWQGEAIAGRTVLLFDEQGIGDTIQFCRYVPMVAARGRVILAVPRRLVRLLSSLDASVTIMAKEDPVPWCDVHCPLPSLPLAFHTGLDSIPAPPAYLTAEPERVAAWRDRLPAGRFRIGIVWRGNPENKDDQIRSVPLAGFETLASLPGVCLISLQKHHGLEQLANLPDGMRVATLGDDFDSGPDAFLDTAAVMMSLDLVITIDSATAHLAGALGCRTWVMLASVPYWVWLHGRNDSPWYPSLRLFRQPKRGEWATVFQAMEAELRGLL